MQIGARKKYWWNFIFIFIFLQKKSAQVHGCQMVFSQTRIPNLGIRLGTCEWKMLVNVIGVHGHLVFLR
jgi:hypothetical protein